MHKLVLQVNMRVESLGAASTYLTKVTWEDVSAGHFKKLVTDLTNVDIAKPFAPDTLKGSHGLEDFYNSLCVKSLKNAWPGWCAAYEAAGARGMEIVVVMVINLVIQVLCCYLLYRYAMRPSASERLRELAAGVVLLGALSQLVLLLLYSMNVIANLDDINQGKVNLIMATDQSGLQPGFVIVIIGVVFQHIEGFLMLFFKRDPVPQARDVANKHNLYAYDDETCITGGISHMMEGIGHLPSSLPAVGQQKSTIGGMRNLAPLSQSMNGGFGVGHQQTGMSFGHQQTGMGMGVGHQQTGMGMGGMVGAQPSMMFGGHQQSMAMGVRPQPTGMMNGSMGLGGPVLMQQSGMMNGLGGPVMMQQSGYGGQVMMQPSQMSQGYGGQVMMQPSQMSRGGMQGGGRPW